MTNKPLSDSNIDLQHLTAFRRILHKLAELSGEEKETNRIINEALSKTKPTIHIKNIGGYGIAVVFKGEATGQRILFRADIDALPIQEVNNFDYRSVARRVSHKCGHDGHSAILYGLALQLMRQKPKRGEVVLLFQPSEETGEGADRVMSDQSFALIKPDIAIALHNLPGFAKNSIVLKDDVFAAASVGLKLNFQGRTAHASQPETGKSPALAMAELIVQLQEIADRETNSDPFSLLTITHARLGDEAFGTAPGKASCWVTLRSFDQKKFETLKDNCVQKSRAIATKHHLGFDYSWHEAFAATVNDSKINQLVKSAAESYHLQLIYLEKPFRWSEDFGNYSQMAKTVLFGIGSGEDCPALHNPDYDFPDEIIPTGVRMFEHICRQITA